MMNSKQKVWEQLLAHQQFMTNKKITQFFAEDDSRFEKLSIRLPVGKSELLFDYSKQYITLETIDLLCKLATACGLEKKIKQLFAGKKLNVTEKRRVWHTELRNTDNQEIVTVLTKMEQLVTSIHNDEYFPLSRKSSNVICLGIGGSNLGAKMTCLALDKYKISKVNMHFVANTDSAALGKLLETLDPRETICLVITKSFNSAETIRNANIIKKWIAAEIDDVNQHFIAITGNTERALEFGVSKEKILPIWEWVGGRYSVWSAAGLPLAIYTGMDVFKKLLLGARMVDQHFASAEFAQNIPVIMAMLGIWNINFWDYNNLAVMPYIDCLEFLPNYLQQLEMESNGKSISLDNKPLDIATAPIVWGGLGQEGQHSYMQFLQQSRQVTPVDFLLAINSASRLVDNQQLMIASCMAQSRALMTGKNSSNAYANCLGNRPNSLFVFDEISPEMLGSIMALYEHKVFVQGVVWDICSFDQWGVEIGKQVTKEIMPMLKEKSLCVNTDSSTKGLLDFYRQYYRGLNRTTVC